MRGVLVIELDFPEDAEAPFKSVLRALDDAQPDYVVVAHAAIQEPADNVLAALNLPNRGGAR